MNSVLIKQGNIVFHNKIEKGDILVDSGYIIDIHPHISCVSSSCQIIDARGLYVFPGIIDTHVHFREPGLTHKATFYSESMAAVAGGITSVIDMPNTISYASDLATIQQKKEIAQKSSLVNIGFFIGAHQHNLFELLNFPKNEVAGIKVFLGSSTGNVKVDDSYYLEELFAHSYLPIVVHAESEPIIQQNLIHFKELYKDDIPFECHSLIRNREACIVSTSMAVELARTFGNSLHVLHISTAEELDFFDDSSFPNITAEVCIPHLWFSQEDFRKHKGLLKCNPSVKTLTDKENLRKHLASNKIYSIATDHAPHSIEEKQQPYLLCPSGTTSIQHSLLSILELYHQHYIDLPTISRKMALHPAQKFNIQKRGSIEIGNYADITIVNLENPTHVTKNSLLYKCQWSVFEGFTFQSSIEYTLVNGEIAYYKGKINDSVRGLLLEYCQ